MNLKALDTSSRSCRCRGSSSWHWPRHLHLLPLLLVLLSPLPLVLLLKVPLLPTTPCSNQANLAPLPSSLTSSPAYTTLQSPDFKRNPKFRSSGIFPLTKYKYPPISHPRLQRMKCQVPIWKFEAPPLSENVKKALDEGKGWCNSKRYNAAKFTLVIQIQCSWADKY